MKPGVVRSDQVRHGGLEERKGSRQDLRFICLTCSLAGGSPAGGQVGLESSLQFTHQDWCPCAGPQLPLGRDAFSGS